MITRETDPKSLSIGIFTEDKKYRVSERKGIKVWEIYTEQYSLTPEIDTRKIIIPREHESIHVHSGDSQDMFNIGVENEITSLKEILSNVNINKEPALIPNGPTIDLIKLYKESLNESIWLYTGLSGRNFTVPENSILIIKTIRSINPTEQEDGVIVHLFARGPGTYGPASGNIVRHEDFIEIYESGYSTTMSLGYDPTHGEAEFSNLTYQGPLTDLDTVSAYLKNLGRYKVDTLDNISLNFSWVSDGYPGTQPRSRYSDRIGGGNVKLLSLEFSDFTPLKSKEDVEYYLLIDRYRCNSRKAGAHRKAKYRHEKPEDALENNRVNEILITSPTMILDFGQEYYFRPSTSGVSDPTIHNSSSNIFPSPTGMSSNKNMTGAGSIRKGYVDLAFRIRLVYNGEIKHETPYLGNIRMIGVRFLTDPDSFPPYISYTLNK